MSLCSSFFSIITVPVLLPCLKPCKVSFRIMVLCILLLIIDTQNFWMNSTNTIPLYPPPLLGMITIVVHTSASGMRPSRNATSVILTSFSHFSVSGYFYLVASFIHAFSCYDFMTDGPPALIARSFCTEDAISYPSGGLSAILTGCTSIGIGSPSGGRRL